MSEQNCKLKQSENVKRFTFDTEQRSVGEIQVIIDNKEKKVYANCFSICEKLNEQQELIEELQVSDEMGWKRAEHFEKELKQKKIYIKRLEYKVQKFKEENEKLKDFIELMNMRQKWKLYNTGIKRD